MKVSKTSLLLCCLLVGWFVAVGLSGATASEVSREKLKQERVKELLAQGLTAHRKNDIETAVARWNEVLVIDPGNERATIYLKEVEPEHQTVQAAKREKEETVRAEADARRRMDEKITIEVKSGTKLREFLNTLSFVSGINFVIVHGAEASVAAKFEDKPLRDVLDAVLLPNGLTWTRKGDIITIMPNLRTRVFRLSTDTFANVQRLYETNDLQKILWNADAPPIQGIELRMDDRQAAVLLTDSPENIKKMEQFLASVDQKAPLRLSTRIFAVRSDLAQNIKTLVEAMLTVETGPTAAVERRVLVAEHENGTELIVRDTEENLRKIESLLRDRDFLRRLEKEELEVYTVNLTPRDVLKENKEMVAAWAHDVVEVIDTMLYHDPGREESRKAGRRRWFDENTYQLTITDHPSNIRKVAEFVQALPQLEPKFRSKILFLENALAGDMASRLQEIMGIGAGMGRAGAAAGNEASLSMRVEDERTFRDLSIRLVRVEENNFGDENDDSCQLVVRLQSGPSSDLSIVEYRSETFEEYEIYAEKVDPSSVPGEGRVRLKVTYRPASETGPGY